MLGVSSEGKILLRMELILRAKVPLFMYSMSIWLSRGVLLWCFMGTSWTATATATSRRATKAVDILIYQTNINSYLVDVILLGSEIFQNKKGTTCHKCLGLIVALNMQKSLR